MQQLAIDEYGIIGNLRTCALIGVNGSLDFMCYPKFNSPTIFARLLDYDRGGHFSIEPLIAHQTANDSATLVPLSKAQHYLPNSNVLSTRFMAENAVGQVTDYMPLPELHVIDTSPVYPWVIRHIEAVRGSVTFRIECAPAFDYGRKPHTARLCPYDATSENALNLDKVSNSKSRYSKRFSVSSLEDHAGERVIFASDDLVLDLRAILKAPIEDDLCQLSMNESSDDEKSCQARRVVPWQLIQRDKMLGPVAVADITLHEGQELILVLREDPDSSPTSKANSLVFMPKQMTFGDALTLDPEFDLKLLMKLKRDTLSFWTEWLQSCTYDGRWRESVHRAALALKLLTYAPTGAIVASPTFGLPESIGGVRNWDYRYSWVRDASFTIYALIRIGFTTEAHDYWQFMESRCKDLKPDGSLNVMYTIDGEKEMPEIVLERFEGYRGSKPVRIGNAAAEHLQLDIYGELMDAAYLYNKFGEPISYDLWCSLRRLVNYVCSNWKNTDMSIWETRGKKEHFVYSKVMCWVAVDRGIRLSEKRTLPNPDRQRWLSIRDEIYEEIMEKGYCQKQQHFIQRYGCSVLDTATLIMPLDLFIAPNDPRMLNTIEAVMRPPSRGGLLVNNLCLRYHLSDFEDGLPGPEGTFAMCTFWLVEALSRAGKYSKKYLEQAQLIFEQLLGYGNHLGLFSEEIARGGELLGNFPQGFTHIALISTAFNLNIILRQGSKY